jgi:hypothetical protein
VYVSRRVPQHLADDPVLLGEGLSGALYWKDFVSLAVKVGFRDPRLVEVHACMATASYSSCVSASPLPPMRLTP